MWRIASGIFMGWSLGSNDAANIFGIGVTSRLIRFRTATILLSIFVILGAYLEGPKCFGSLQKLGDLVLNQAFICTFSAGLSVLFLTIMKIPASTSQAIVGAIIGAAILTSKPNWLQFRTMALCWVMTPVGGAIIGYTLYVIVDHVVRRLKQSTRTIQRFLFFTMILAGCFGSYALGANNVANSTGVYVNTGLLDSRTGALIGGISIALGAATFSRKVMDTIGNRITIIGPQSAVIATLAHSLTIYLYAQIGVPVSSSQAIVGSVIGIGMVRGIKAVNLKILGAIALGWIITPVSAGILALTGVYLLYSLPFILTSLRATEKLFNILLSSG